jgi:hypothetical protein
MQFTPVGLHTPPAFLGNKSHVVRSSPTSIDVHRAFRVSEPLLSSSAGLGLQAVAKMAPETLSDAVHANVDPSEIDMYDWSLTGDPDEDEPSAEMAEDSSIMWDWCHGRAADSAKPPAKKVIGRKVHGDGGAYVGGEWWTSKTAPNGSTLTTARARAHGTRRPSRTARTT